VDGSAFGFVLGWVWILALLLNVIVLSVRADLCSKAMFGPHEVAELFCYSIHWYANKEIISIASILTIAFIIK